MISNKTAINVIENRVPYLINGKTTTTVIVTDSKDATSGTIQYMVNQIYS